jgi:hypothetical protein
LECPLPDVVAILDGLGVEDVGLLVVVWNTMQLREDTANGTADHRQGCQMDEMNH